MNRHFKAKYEELQKQKTRKKKKKDAPYFMTSQPLLEVGTRVRVALDKPKDYIESNKLSGTFRATDPRWENRIRTITNIIINDNQPIMYKVSGLPSVAYTYNRLQVVPINEVPPPAKVRRDIKA
jgi:hypothetical protein